MLALLAAVEAILAGPAAERVFVAPREGDVRQSHTDIGQAARTLHWRPTVSLEDGLRETIGSLSAGALP